jgi:TolB-like protein/Flp pilus assembly protein TadD
MRKATWRAEDRSGQLRFGTFEADLEFGQLTKLGRPLRLQEQPFRVLTILLQRPGILVTREDLQAAVWPKTTVDYEHGLNKAISKIREALGDSAMKPRFIETVPRRGYRFLADVAHAAIRSLAVLPFVDISGDAGEDYFADGMTEELITDLGQIGALHVISRTSVMTYKGAHKSLRDIGRELAVDVVVEGSVLRLGQRVRINAQLIEVPADRHIWAQSYTDDLGNALALQGRVAQDIAQQIQAVLTVPERAALEKSTAVKPEAFESYLKGRYFWNKRTGDGLKAAIAHFDRAIEMDVTFAQAYAGLADSYALAGDWQHALLSPEAAFAKAKAAAARALKLNDSLGEAHASLAFALDLYGWDWDSAGYHYRRAIDLNPGYATARQWYAWHLIVTGSIFQGIAELRKAASLDPLSLIIGADLADALCIARLHDESIEQARNVINLAPDFAATHYVLGQALEQKHMHDEAIAAYERAIGLAGHNGAFDSNLAFAYALSGRPAEAAKIAHELQVGYDGIPSTAANIALVYVGLGDNDRAMSWLDNAYNARFNPSILLRPAWDSLRPDPRFQRLLHRIGLPRQVLPAQRAVSTLKRSARRA